MGIHRFGTLKQWLGWLWGALRGRAVTWTPEHVTGELKADQEGTKVAGERVSGEGHIGQQPKARLLQQDSGLSGQLLGYPGQQPGAGASTPGAIQGQPGNPRPLFPTAIAQPPPTPAPQQLLQVSNNADGGQRSPPGPPLQSVDTASSFSALDVGSPPAITSPSVAVVSDSPCAPPPSHCHVNTSAGAVSPLRKQTAIASMPAWPIPDLSDAQTLAWLAQDGMSTAQNTIIARAKEKFHLCYVHAATPALGMYPSDTLINTPQAFPGDSPSPSPAGATGTIATPPASPTPTAVPIGTGSDLGTGHPEACTCPLSFCLGSHHQCCPVKAPLRLRLALLAHPLGCMICALCGLLHLLQCLGWA